MMAGIQCKYCGSTNTRTVTNLKPLNDQSDNEEQKFFIKCLSCNQEYPYEETE